MIYIIIFIIIIFLLFSEKKENFWPKECRGKEFQNGIKFTNMEVCRRKCPKYTPENYKKKDYCKEVRGMAICYPPHWKFS
jgi:hypothetical protein